MASSVRKLAIQPDGNVVIAGSFGISRLTPTGTGDSGFNPGSGPNAEGAVSVAVQPDAKILIGGSFTAVNGTNRLALARLHPNGSLDLSFNPDLASLVYYDPIPPQFGGEHSTVVTAIRVQADGKVLAAGYTLTLVTAEETFAVSIRAFLVRFLANGNADPSFAPAIANATDGESYWFYGWHFYPPSALAVQPDGQILLGGVFNSLNGTNRNGIARLNSNGTVDNSFVPATASYVRVSALALQADGKVLAGGGYFGTVNGTNTYGITRFHANGSYDAAFNTGTGTGGGSQVVSVALQPDGKVLIAGSFTNFNGTSRNGLARLNANGSLDGGFNPGAGAKGISSIALQSDGRILIGGGFLTYNGVLRPFVARLLGDSPWPVLSPARSGGSLSLTWPMTALNFQLQESTNLALASAWSPVAQTPVTDGPQQSVSVSTGGERKFFRLESQ